MGIKKGDKTKSKGVFRMSVVGKEGDSAWVEQKMTIELPKPKKEHSGAVMKMLMGKDGIEKAYVKTPQGVMDMSGMMAAASRRKPAPGDKARMKEVGTEEVSVPAGKFKATHLTFAEGPDAGDAYAKPGVGPYGLIKQVHRVGKSVTTIELLASGDDAKSEVDEKTAMSFGSMMMNHAGAGKEPGEDKASDEPAAPAMPGLGGMFKKALKAKAGLGE